MISIQEFFDPATSTLTYAIWDQESGDAVVVDPVWDYDAAASKLTTGSVDKLIQFLQKSSMRPHLILETHAHADHISGAQLIKKAFPQAKIAIGERIQDVQKVFAELFGLPKSFSTQGEQFDRLLKNGEPVEAGSLRFTVRETPGHTPACSCFVFDGLALTGDALFMPDSGTGRCDFPEGDAATLFDSITKQIYSLPDETKLYTGHDYQPGGRPLAFCSTVAEQKKSNIHLKAQTSKEVFVAFRTGRDKTLQAPGLLLQSIQINIAGGKLPAPQGNGRRYLTIPVVE